MSYPNTIPTFLDAARALTPPADITAQYYNAVYGGPVTAAVTVLNLLKDRDDLSQDALKVLLGAADLIRQPQNQWHGLAGEAATVLATRAKDLTDA